MYNTIPKPPEGFLSEAGDFSSFKEGDEALLTEVEEQEELQELEEFLAEDKFSEEGGKEDQATELGDNLLYVYCSQIGKIPLLSAKEEVAPFRSMEAGKTEIMQALLWSPLTADLVLKLGALIRRGKRSLYTLARPRSEGVFEKTYLFSRFDQIAERAARAQKLRKQLRRAQHPSEKETALQRTLHEQRAVIATLLQELGLQPSFLRLVKPEHQQTARKNLDKEYPLITDDRIWTVAYVKDNGPVRSSLYNRATKQARFLFTKRQEIFRRSFTPDLCRSDQKAAPDRPRGQRSTSKAR